MWLALNIVTILWLFMVMLCVVRDEILLLTSQVDQPRSTIVTVGRIDRRAMETAVYVARSGLIICGLSYSSLSSIGLRGLHHSWLSMGHYHASICDKKRSSCPRI